MFMTTRTVSVWHAHSDIGWQMNTDVFKLMINVNIGPQLMVIVQIVTKDGCYQMENVYYHLKFQVELSVIHL